MGVMLTKMNIRPSLTWEIGFQFNCQKKKKKNIWKSGISTSLELSMISPNKEFNIIYCNLII